MSITVLYLLCLVQVKHHVLLGNEFMMLSEGDKASLDFPPCLQRKNLVQEFAELGHTRLHAVEESDIYYISYRFKCEEQDTHGK